MSDPNFSPMIKDTYEIRVEQSLPIICVNICIVVVTNDRKASARKNGRHVRSEGSDEGVKTEQGATEDNEFPYCFPKRFDLSVLEGNHTVNFCKNIELP